MLSIRELRLLTELARRADRIMAREELFSLVWGREMRAGRPLGRRLRAQAAGQARAGAAGVAVHPHALRFRLSPGRRATNARRNDAVHNWLTPCGRVAARDSRAHLSEGEDIEYTSHQRGGACWSPHRSRSPRAARAAARARAPRAARRRASSSSSAAAVSATLNGAGSTLAAPIYQQWGSNAQVPGPDGQLQPASARAPGSPICRRRPSTSPAADPALKPV